MNVWIAVTVTGVGCYLLKLAGLVAPQRVLEDPRVRRFTELVPVALLASLVAVQTVTTAGDLRLDGARIAGVTAAGIAFLLRAPFLVALVTAAVVAAGLRLL
ncbi:AzlD domain-containing protein [Actinomadura rayongensis]|uniref:AzlD domain-containing protein n=1 Tax=Actinomadura rayongensis TaxID=1429076 RepID=A0A6I4WAH8_9ACTN|nr:AzlD domain-containing protein [Actinomadura rayongensis]MXQ64074.1 AzlD domain-containing protein [Actinomadura rayongensis]